MQIWRKKTDTNDKWENEYARFEKLSSRKKNYVMVRDFLCGVCRIICFRVQFFVFKQTAILCLSKTLTALIQRQRQKYTVKRRKQQRQHTDRSSLESSNIVYTVLSFCCVGITDSYSINKVKFSVVKQTSPKMDGLVNEIIHLLLNSIIFLWCFYSMKKNHLLIIKNKPFNLMNFHCFWIYVHSN